MPTSVVIAELFLLVFALVSVGASLYAMFSESGEDEENLLDIFD